MKEKKIGIRFTLQKSLKPDFVLIAENGQEEDQEAIKYPVYAQVTYNRKNTKFKYLSLMLSENEFLDNSNEALLIQAEESIRRIVELEVEVLGDNFTLKGIGKRFDKYQDKVYEGIYNVVSELLSYTIDNLSTSNDLNGKETFFMVGLAGASFTFSLSNNSEKKRLLFDSIINIEQIAGMLMEGNHLNALFTKELRQILNELKHIYYSTEYQSSIFNQTIYNWLNNSIEKGKSQQDAIINSLLTKYIYE